MKHWLFGLCIASCAVPIATISVTGQSAERPGEWRTYGGDLASTRYLPVEQITGRNFGSLEIAWRFKTDNLGPRPEFNLQATPLMANGVLYTVGGTRRSVVALDPATGELRWVYRHDEGARGQASPRLLSGRGLSYWQDGQDERIVYVTPGYQMIALDAKTGRPIREFGKDGVVDLKQDMDQTMDLVTGEVGLHAAPVIARNVIVIGAAHRGGATPKSRANQKGYVRGYDVRTGKRRWIFHTIPRPGELGNDTWHNDSWSYTGNTGVWGQMTVDEELGHVYLPVEDATGDYYGGHRPGNNLFSSSLVALDIETGRRVWHYQFIHHDIWDFDIPCAPILANITVNGRAIKAIAQPTKQAWVYVFDRVTGQPVWPIEERPVPQGDVPGEWYSPTQPFPSKPPAFDRQGLTTDDLIDFTPELRAEALKLVSRYKIGPMYTPPVVSKPGGPAALLLLPAPSGGANWPGGSFDPETNILYVASNTEIGAIGLVQDSKRSDMNFIQGRAATPGETADAGLNPSDVQGLPLVKPPWSRITAIDLNAGDIVWQVAHGEMADSVRNHPALKGLQLPRTGRFADGRIGTLVTKTLLIAGEAGFVTTADGRRGALLRAYDKATGKDVAQVYMPAPQTGSPMTYMFDGKQYIVVAVSGGTYSGELMALRLPR